MAKKRVKGFAVVHTYDGRKSNIFELGSKYANLYPLAIFTEQKEAKKARRLGTTGHVAKITKVVPCTINFEL